MTVVGSPLGTKETAGPADLNETSRQQATSRCQEIRVAVSPIWFIHKHVPEFDERSISKSRFREHPFDAFVGCLCFCPNAHAGTIGAQSDIDHGLYVVLAYSTD